MYKRQTGTTPNATITIAAPTITVTPSPPVLLNTVALFLSLAPLSPDPFLSVEPPFVELPSVEPPFGLSGSVAVSYTHLIS